MAVSVYGPTDREATVPQGEQMPERVFQLDQMQGSLSGATVEQADAWLEQARANGALRGYYGTRGWIDPRTERGRCPWGATWYREVAGRLHLYLYNWDSSD